jgi:ABC-type lipoprotein release transport system permease subunit
MQDPGLFVVVMAILPGVVFVAAFIPARRAARVNPTIALRCE